MKTHAPSERTSSLRFLAPAGLLLAAALSIGALAISGAPGSSAAEERPTAPSAARQRPLRLGTFESRAIAVAFAHSKFMTATTDLMKEHEKAKAAGDKARMKELEAKLEKLQDKFHRQGFGNYPVDDLLVPIQGKLPEICKAAGVDAIVSGIVHADPSVEKVDVTDILVKPYEPSEATLKMIAELRKQKPLDFEAFPIKD